MMQYSQINKNTKISKISFGAEWIGELTQQQVNDLMQHCINQGVNLVDCWMSDPKIRDKLGEGLKATKRENWIIQGHIGSTWQNGQYKRTREINKVKEAFEDLLKRLQTDHIDYGMIHYVDEVKEYDTIMNNDFIKYIHQLKDEGKIKQIGLSTHNPEVAIKAAKNPDIKLILFSLNPAYDIMPPTENIEDYSDKTKYENLKGIAPQRAQLYQLCEDTNTHINVMKAYAGGRLFNKQDSPFDTPLTPLQCISYALDIKPVISVCLGIKNTQQLDEALHYFNATEDEKNYQEILKNLPKHSFEGTCTYCGHCLPCIQEINIPMVNKLYDLAKIYDMIPESIREHYNNLQKHASDCIECGVCIENCPFNVDIIKYMQDAKKLFEY